MRRQFSYFTSILRNFCFHSCFKWEWIKLQLAVYRLSHWNPLWEYRQLGRHDGQVWGIQRQLSPQEKREMKEYLVKSSGSFVLEIWGVVTFVVPAIFFHCEVHFVKIVCSIGNFLVALFKIHCLVLPHVKMLSCHKVELLWFRETAEIIINLEDSRCQAKFYSGPRSWRLTLAPVPVVTLQHISGSNLINGAPLFFLIFNWGEKRRPTGRKRTNTHARRLSSLNGDPVSEYVFIFWLN